VCLLGRMFTETIDVEKDDRGQVCDIDKSVENTVCCLGLFY